MPVLMFELKSMFVVTEYLAKEIDQALCRQFYKPAHTLEYEFVRFTNNSIRSVTE